MKTIILSFLLFFLLINCRNEMESTDPIHKHNLTTIAGWPMVDFKESYTIQVPSEFIGAGLEGFEGKSFYKSSPDHEIILYGGYGTSLFVFDFGDTLQHPFPKSIQVISSKSNLIVLDQVEYFYQEEELKGVLYYSYNYSSRGRLYWKDEAAFKEALEIDFNLSELETVNKIIQSIKQK